MVEAPGGGADHPLVRLFAGLPRGIYPGADGLTEVMPRPEGAVGAVLTFTGHIIVAANVDPEWVRSRCPPGDFLTPVSPSFLLELGERLGHAPGSHCLVLCSAGEEGEPDLPLALVDPEYVHPRPACRHSVGSGSFQAVERANRRRTDVRVYRTPGSEGLLTIGPGLAGRWEAGFEVAEEARNRGLGRALVAASRRLIGAGEGVFMQTAVGNIASLRAILAGGFVPVGAEVLFK